jgi:DNA-binding response OmpR family regulator
MIKRVLFLDDDEDLRASVEDVLHARYETACTVFGTYEELVKAGTSVLDHDLAILDINLGPGVPSGIDAYQWLRQLGFRGRVLFLTGHARSHPEVAKARDLEDAQIAQKPMELEELDQVFAENAPQ